MYGMPPWDDEPMKVVKALIIVVILILYFACIMPRLMVVTDMDNSPFNELRTEATK